MTEAERRGGDEHRHRALPRRAPRRAAAGRTCARVASRRASRLPRRRGRGGRRDERQPPRRDRQRDPGTRDRLHAGRQRRTGPLRDRRRVTSNRRPDVRHLLQLWQRDSARTAGGEPLGFSLHRLQAKSRGRVNEPLRQLEVRVGSATDALTPLSRATRSFAATRAQWLALAAIALAAVVADQVTKHVVASHLSLGEGVHVVGPFTVRHVQNSGIAFGLFSNATAAVIVVTAIAIAWMLAYFARSGARHPVLPVALGLVIGGSASNLADRVRLGFVTDFLDFRYWPAFNLADSFIVIGVGILLAALVLAEREPRASRH